MYDCFGTTFHHIDCLVVSGFCRIRKIFGCKFPLRDSLETMNTQLKHEILPSNYEFPQMLSASSQIISPSKISLESTMQEAPSRLSNYSPTFSRMQDNYEETSPQRSIKIRNKVFENKAGITPDPNKQCNC